MFDTAFFQNKRVFVTGHTGFKGSWLCRILAQYGAQVYGFSLPPTETNALYHLCHIDRDVVSSFGDLADFFALQNAFDAAKPEIVFHLAAQPIVRVGYREPLATYRTNVMGTVHLLECIRQSDTVRSVVNVTTDKVYQNREWEWGYRETDRLDGFDPYANSKSCAELITGAYRRSYLTERVAISTARAGNVIGGGDFAPDRILPDCVRAATEGTPLILRNPNAVRPYQHVLEPLFFYLLLAEKQWKDPALAGAYNVGPDDVDCATTQEVVALFATAWGRDFSYRVVTNHSAPHEASLLKLDCAKAKTTFGWRPVWSLQTAVEQVVSFTETWWHGGDARACMSAQIQAFAQDTNLLFTREMPS